LSERENTKTTTAIEATVDALCAVPTVEDVPLTAIYTYFGVTSWDHEVPAPTADTCLGACDGFGDYCKAYSFNNDVGRCILYLALKTQAEASEPVDP